MPSPSGAKLRARAARKAYKSVISDVDGKDTGGEYSPRAVTKSMAGGKRAKAAGKQLAASARNPAKRRTAVPTKVGSRKGVIVTSKKSTLNFTKLSKALLTHASEGEVRGVTRDIRQAYKKNLRTAKKKKK